MMHWIRIAGLGVGIVILSLNLCWAQATLTWEGDSPLGNPTVWEEPENWDMGWVPTEDDDVVIPSGLTNYPNLTFGDQFFDNIHIETGAVLSVSVGGTPTLNVGGNWIDEGTFTAGGSTVKLEGTANCTLSTETFNRLEVNKYYVTPFGVIPYTAYMTGDVEILDEITFEYGILETSGFDLIGTGISNNLLLNNGQLKWGREYFTTTFETVEFDSGTVHFNRDGDQVVPSAYDYYDLHARVSGVKALDGHVRIGGDLFIYDDAVFDIGGFHAEVMENIGIYGCLTMGDESILAIGEGSWLRVHPRALFSAVGTGGMRTGPIITREPLSAGYYALDVYGDSAVISASYATFEYMDLMGVDLDSAAIIDPAHPLDHCRFQYGDPTSYSSALIHIDNIQEITIPYADFPVMGAANVRKEVDYGRVTFLNATGIFAGEAYEVDFHDRIDWVESVPPVPPIVVIERDGVSARLIWNTVTENTGGFPITVDSYKVYSDTDPHGAFTQLEVEVLAPDTTWTDVGILSTDELKFYQVTAIEY